MPTSAPSPRLQALAAYIEADPEAGGMFSFLTPSYSSRTFPSEDFWNLVEGWADDPAACDLAEFTLRLVRVELAAAREAELPALV